jgi:hypothetical protein
MTTFSVMQDPDRQDLPVESISTKRAPPHGLALLLSLALSWVSVVGAQAQWSEAPTTPTAQRNALNLVLNQVNWFQNSTRTATSYAGSGGYGLLLQQFQTVRDQYAALKGTLTPQQLTSGGGQLAELDAGLDIIQQAFTDYQAHVGNGQPSHAALANMCRVLNEALGVWAQELKQDCPQSRVGW